MPTEIGAQVWVEKYKPKTMKQIIGQQGDKSNAHKLHHWLKNWQSSRSNDGTRPKPSEFPRHEPQANERYPIPPNIE